MSSSPLAIWWVRRDLRLTDNQALEAAINHGRVIPLFILDPALLDSPFSGSNRIAFLFDGLRMLDTDLQGRGSRLLIRQGNPSDVLAQLAEETGATAIFAEEDFSPYARSRDDRVQETVPMLERVQGVTGLPVGSVEKKSGGPYVVYTPYKRSWLQEDLPEKHHIWQAPEEIDTPPGLVGVPIPSKPTLEESIPFPAGEGEALNRLKKFVLGDAPPVYGYDKNRDNPAIEGTSMLSPYLRFGMISVRRVIVAARHAIQSAPSKEAKENAEVWLSELIWRDFYINVLHFFPHVRGSSFREEYDEIAWRDDEAGFEAWKAGRTGYPFVDAAMRQLQGMGWMHNRARMVVASFLVKDLLIDWRWGERWFMQMLVDGDPAANNGGWQWAAGTGTDAAPYFRIFNPITQGKRYDSNGDYIRRWVPELANVPDKYIHEPWTMPKSDQVRARCQIGNEYPAPIVNHKEARERTLEAYSVVKK